ncbi:ATP-dependent nuclease [Micrococcus sp. H39-S4]|uniref:ATP-dependent nuclease n=1 Tax=Micrococcus sp. H39-S4 TaxID=3004356 RepID=UPI0022B041B7|nr:AAA family ATPase [Micrococcus sp. H39-S4]MCZ4071221.1 AAA family ATPase [Micrococcus sp. H39-S4]
MIDKVRIQGYRVFRDFDMAPSPGINLIVGDNGSGKSTLLEAMTMALSGHINGKWAQDELNPYWFNADLVKDFFAEYRLGKAPAAPEILIELYFKSNSGEEADPDLQLLRGVHNSAGDDAPGLKITIRPSTDYLSEIAEYMNGDSRPDMIPVEYYEVVWESFAGALVRKRPKGLGLSTIDARTVKSSWGIDYHTRQMLNGFMEPRERAQVSIANRAARAEITNNALKAVNDRIGKDETVFNEDEISLGMDQSSAATWENTVVPHLSSIPFALAGQGEQASLKVSLAMFRSAGSTTFVMVEEPENHLSHTALTRLIARIDSLAGNRQVFIATHSSYVINRLGLDRLRLLSGGKGTNFASLSPDTVSYFKKLSGFDTLRIVLARHLVLVEGPSDEMIFEKAYNLIRGVLPINDGVDVLSMNGVALARALELCHALDRQVAALRDNDGESPAHWKDKFKSYLVPGKRQLFIGDPSAGATLEPQLMHSNTTSHLRKMLRLDAGKDVADWMTANKTEAALRLAEDPGTLEVPEYIQRAIEFINE